MAYTQGKWILDEDGFISVANSDSYVIDYAGCGSHECHWENEADKALVLAAPELLEALRNVVRGFNGEPVSCSGHPLDAAARLIDELEKKGV
jgi:hypothetical protein